MTARFYAMPLEVVGTARGPKYLKWRFNASGVDVLWSLIDFGLEPTCLVAADVDATQHATLAANADVIAAPANIDSLIDTEGERNTVRTKLDTLNIPSVWVQTGMTYREVLRPVAHLILLAQRYFAQTGRKMIEPGYTWSTLVSNLPVNVRNDLNAAAQSLGYDTSGVTGGMTYGAAMKLLGDQWGATPVLFGSIATL